MKHVKLLSLIMFLGLMTSFALPGYAVPKKLHFNTVQLKTGVKIHYAEQGDPKGIAVVFLHGYPDSWNSFRLVLKQLSPKYHAFALDQRGFGDSSRPTGGYSQKDYAADAVAFLDALKIKKATFVGHSMGSFIAQTVAILYPKRVERLVLIGSAPTAHGNPVILDVQKTVLPLKDPISRKFVYDFQISTVYHTVPNGFIDSVISESQKAPARVWKAALNGLANEDHSTILNKITQPTFIAWGDHDVIFTKQDQNALLKAIPHSKLKVYRNAGHSLNWDNAPAFTKDLESFLN
jgi:non-heme chloroperoxidase